eukprot:jgi/Botrbrau1/5280/Bobra.0391s0001.1
MLYAQLAASCAALSSAIRLLASRRGAAQKIGLFPSWAVLDFQLAAALSFSIRNRLSRIQMSDRHPEFLRTNPQVRLILYMGSITGSLLNAMAGLETAIVTALHGEGVRYKYGARLSPTLEGSLDETLCQAQLCHVHLTGPESDIGKAHSLELDREAEKTASLVGVSLRLDDSHKRRDGQVLRRALSEPGLPFEPLPLFRASLEAPSSLLNAATSFLSSGGGWLLTPFRKWRVWDTGWAVRLFLVLTGVTPLRTAFTTLFRSAPKVLASPKAFLHAIRHEARLQFFFKVWLGGAAALLTVLLVMMSPNYDAVMHWYPQYGVTTVFVILSETVDGAFSIAVLRVLGTILGGVTAFVMMVSPALANNPYGLSVLLAAMAACAGVCMLYKWKYVAALAMITLNSLVLQQYDPPNGRGSVQLFYVRLAEILAGIFFAMPVELLLPKYMTKEALKTVAKLFGEATHLTEIYLEALQVELEMLSGGEASHDASRGLEPLVPAAFIRDQLSRPLTALQASFARDAVTWSRGVLVMPSAVTDLIRCMTALVDRLSALRAMLFQKPLVSGHFSGVPHHTYMLPLQDRFRTCIARLKDVSDAVLQVVSGHPTLEHVLDLGKATNQLVEARLQLRRQFLLVDAELRGRAARGETTPGHFGERTLDDSIRLKTCFYAFCKVVDACITLARTLAADEWVQVYAMRERHRWALIWLPHKAHAHFTAVNPSSAP